MVDKLKVELDEQFLKKFFGLTDRMIPDGQEITNLMLKNQLDEIEETIKAAADMEKELNELKKQAQSHPQQKPNYQKNGAIGSFDEEPEPIEEVGLNLPKKSILVIDDLGVITYQLGVVLKKMGYDTAESREIYDAIEKFKKQDFDLVIMDLFIPTEREGFILLEELKKTSSSKRKQAKIGVMSASAKKEHKQLCKMKGAEFYIEKVDNWQKELLNIVRNLI